MNIKKRFLSGVIGPLMGMGVAQGVAIAQEQPVMEESPQRILEEIVVTGTFIRGIKPTGSQVLGITADNVKAVGAISSSELLSSLPQASNLFNERTTISPGGGSQVQVIRPNLRNLPGGDFATGAATLILMDGHRLPGVGVSQVAPDPDMIPLGIIERVEIITDGGSSIYGADAIGGVINFITKRRFDGIQIDAGYNIADNYTSFDTNITAGKTWDNGSVYMSYSYADQDEILIKDRSWAKDINWTTGLGFDDTCALPNVSITPAVGPSVNYAAPGFVPNTHNHCDNSQGQALSPSMERENVFAGLSWNFGNSVELDVRAFYSERSSSARQGPQGEAGRMESQNPYYIDIDGMGSPQSVLFNFSPHIGSRNETTSFESWGITPELKVTFSNDWQLSTLFNYGKSQSNYFTPVVNTSLVTEYGQGTTIADAVNYYDIAQTINLDLLDNLLDWAVIGEAEHEIINGRVIADGDLFRIPGGDVRFALGVEYFEEEYSRREGRLRPADKGSLPKPSYKRDVSSVFGELMVPVVGASNRLAGIESLDLSLSVRHDDYSDFGSTTNPKIGITWSPVNWVNVRGSWGESFNAPTPLDQLASQLNTITAFPAHFVPNPADPPSQGATLLAVQGAAPNLMPQEATTWSVGLDIEPPVVPGLRASLNYYEIDFEGTLSKPPSFNPSELYTNFPDYFILYPTAEQIEAAGALAPGGDAIVAPFLLPGSSEVYSIIFSLTDNLGNTKIKGLDFSLNQILENKLGVLDFGISGNYRLDSKTQAGAGLPWRDDLKVDEPKYFLKASAGLTRGNFRAQADWNYRDGYDVIRIPGFREQDHVSSFQTVDLFFRYDLQGGWRDDLTLSLNINNVFDRDPPTWRQDGNRGYVNGFTLGRMFRFGVSKRF